MSREYDPFSRGPFPAGVRTIEAPDAARKRCFPCEVWYPATAEYAGRDLAQETQDHFSDPPSRASRRQMAVRDSAANPGNHPLVVFSHSSGDRRRQSTFLCTHLASHGYAVAALDHSEVVAPELWRPNGETSEQRAARIEGWIANRVPDICFLLDELLVRKALGSDVRFDASRVGIAGHSFGGWTALATPEVESRIGAVVALAPGGSSNPPPDIIPAKLTFAWEREVPTLFLVAEDDRALPLSGMYEIFERAGSPKRMVILRGADHGHFGDEIEPQMRQCSRDQAHLFVRGLTLCHMDATMRGQREAQAFWDTDVSAVLARAGVDAAVAAGIR